MTLPRFAGALLLIACFAGLSAAQDQKQQDAQSRFEPRSSPGAGQKFLEKFVGDWDVVKTFHPANGDPVDVKGECQQKMIHDGRFLQSLFTFEQAGVKTTGQGLIGYEEDSGKFTSVWTDSRATRMSLRRSEEKFDGEKITLVGKSLEEEASNGRKSRTVTTLEDGGNKIVHRQYTISADGAERVIMELVMTRKTAK